MKDSIVDNSKKQLKTQSECQQTQMDFFSEKECLKKDFSLITWYDVISGLVETEMLSLTKNFVVNNLMRKRVNNFFISTTSGVFKEQMAKYLAKEIFSRDCFVDYVIVVPKFSPGDSVEDFDYEAIFKDLFTFPYVKAPYKFIIFINDFDKKCEEGRYDIFFDLLKKIKKECQVEELKLIGTVSLEQLEYNDSDYFSPEMKYHILGVQEPKVEEFQKTLIPKIQELKNEHKVKISDSLMEYFDLMYIVQNVGNYSMSFYLDSLDAVFSIAKANSRNKVKRSDIHEAFEMFVTKFLAIPKSTLKEICYHEAGHCVIAKMIFGKDYKIRALSCIADCNNLLGTIVGNIEKMEYALEENLLYQYIAFCLGGILAEELIQAEANTGAQQDLEDAMNVAKEWLMNSGANEALGKYCYYNIEKLSNKKLEILENEAEKIIKEASIFGRNVLNDNRKFLDMLAEELFKKKILSEKDVESIYEKSLK